MSEVLANEVTVSDAAPVSHATACEACGAPIDPLDKFCGACGAPNEAEAKEEQSPDQEDGEPKQKQKQRFFRCKNCGAEVATDPTQRSYVCPFCDSTYVQEFSPRQSGRKEPEFVIPFAVTAEKASELFHKWIESNSFFRPGDLKSAKIEEKLKGVYLPFWSFSMLANSNWSATVGEYWYRTETYTTTENGKTVTKTRTVRETEWWDLSGRHHRYYSGYLVSASRGLPQQQADRIKPFHLAALRRFAPGYLAGWLSEEYSVDRDPAEEICRREFHRREDANVKSFLPGDTHRRLRTDTEFSNVSDDLILLPVYLLSYLYGDKLYRFMVNGQTGKVAGDKPLSWARIWGAVGLVIAMIATVVIIGAVWGG